MAYLCFHCGTAVEDSSAQRLGRREACAKCKRDLHVCKNCEHYDTSAYNHCRESQADRVLDKEQSNFCDYFSFSQRGAKTAADSGKSNTRAQLDALFKK